MSNIHRFLSLPTKPPDSGPLFILGLLIKKKQQKHKKYLRPIAFVMTFRNFATPNSSLAQLVRASDC